MNETPRKCLAEFVGTFMLTFIGAGSIVVNQLGGNIGLLGIAIAHGLALSIAVSATMNVSGGHINPAVTIAMLTRGRISLGDALGYIVAQIFGATFAAVALVFIIGRLPGGGEAIKITGLGTPMPAADLAAGSAGFTAFVTEVFLTFMLGFAIMGTAVDPRAPKIGGFGIGLMIAADIMMGGPISGAAMNPARVLGPAIRAGVWNAHWAYWAGPVLGMCLAVWIYDLAIMEKKSE